MYSFGRSKPLHRITFLFLFFSIFFLLPELVFSKAPPAPDQSAVSAEIDATLATMSDTEVRKRLAEEMQKSAAPASQTNHNPNEVKIGWVMTEWLQSFGTEDEDDHNMLTKFLAGFKALPASFAQVNNNIIPPDFSSSPVVLRLALAAIILFSLIVARLFAHWLTKHYFTLDTSNLPEIGVPAKFISGFIRCIPNLLALFIFVIVGFLIYFFSIGADHQPLNLFFNGALFAICLFFLIRISAQLLLSPSLAAFRIIPVSDRGASTILKAINVFAVFLILTFYTVMLFRGNSLGFGVANAVKEIAATLFTLISIGFVFTYRRPVADYIRSSSTDTGNSQWVTEILAKSWHMLTSFYFLFLWSMLLYDFISSGYRSGQGAFIISFLIIPIWLLINALGQWVTRNVFNTLGIYSLDTIDQQMDQLSAEQQLHLEESHRVFMKARNFTRIAVTVVLGIWLAKLWNFYIPYISELTGVFFDTLLILIIALFFWKTLSSWIERKIFESTSEDEEATDEDSEWAATAKKGRAYTLLPMLKKFVGSILVVMVTLTILSSFGVDIGPLLAGAGVVGLAVGFGAQKLVSDVLSGFFFLLDDAFRVGEYIEAGGISGSVEDITLRNVMLRHHRGMLQIVPHSELGAVTNFMRGGIIVKFNLDFPYDADIDLIRRVIKKVGQSMMEDEEFGKDFIKPVKSAGVREITNSVMTIRVKFTAQPGSHFVIRREAYKRITEALAAKGIHYAHRKVIVDLPHELIDAAKDHGNEKMQQALQIAGAAALAASEQDTAAGGSPSA